MIRAQGDLKTIERVGEPLPHCLDEGLLARPTAEESGRLLVRRQGAQGVVFGGGEETARNRQGVGQVTLRLHVDPQISMRGKGVESEPSGMGEVEAQLAAGQVGFAIVAIRNI